MDIARQAARWDAVANVSDLFSRLIGQANDKLLELGKLTPGCRVLDVGCGTGQLARKAAALVGDQGKVIGIDFATRMVELAKAHQSKPNCEFHVGDAHDLKFPDAVCDAIYCQMGLPFFERPELFLGRALSVLKPGGRLVLMCLGNAEHNDFFRAPNLLDEAALARLTGFGDPAVLVGTLEAAGYVDVRTRPVRALAKVTDLMAYWRVLCGTLGIAGEPPPALQARLTSGAQLSLEIVFALAQKPDDAVAKAASVQSFDTMAARARRQIRELSPVEVTRALGKQVVRYIDVREPEEWSQGTIKGALRIPRGELEQRIVRELPDRATIVVTFCQDGHLGALAAARLHSMGYGAVWNLYGGFAAWKVDGMPIERVA